MTDSGDVRGPKWPLKCPRDFRLSRDINRSTDGQIYFVLAVMQRSVREQVVIIVSPLPVVVNIIRKRYDYEPRPSHELIVKKKDFPVKCAQVSK